MHRAHPTQRRRLRRRTTNRVVLAPNGPAHHYVRNVGEESNLRGHIARTDGDIVRLQENNVEACWRITRATFTGAGDPQEMIRINNGLYHRILRRERRLTELYSDLHAALRERLTMNVPTTVHGFAVLFAAEIQAAAQAELEANLAGEEVLEL